MSPRFLLKEIIACTLNMFHAPISEKGSILMYHSVGVNNKFSSVTPKNFEKHLCFLKEGGYTTIPISKMISKKLQGESMIGCVSITFDDGYRDFYTTVFPLLKKYGIPAALFVVTDFIGGSMKTRQGQEFAIVSEAEIREMSESGLVEIFPHTKTHPKFSEISTEVACTEMDDSRITIERIVGKKSNIFAYPFGITTSDLVAVLHRDKKWEAAVTVEPGLITPQTDIFTLNRNSIDSEVGMCQLRMKVSDSVLALITIKKWFKHA